MAKQALSFLSLLKTEGNADGAVFINSLSAQAEGVLALDRAYQNAETVLGEAACEMKNGELHFTLGADASAVIRLNK